MWKKIKKKWYWLLIVIVLVIAFFVWRGSQGPEVEYSTVTVKRGELIQTVSETGTVKPLKQLALNFPQTGLISQIYVQVGDRVEKDQVLAELNQDALVIREQEAQAGLEVALANQAKLLRGATASEIAVLEAQVRQAKSAYDGAVSDYNNVRKTSAENVSQAEKKLKDLEDESVATPTALEQAVAIARLNLDSGLASYQQALDNSRNVFMNTNEYNVALVNSALDKIRVLLDDDDLKDVYSVKNTTYRTLSEDDYEAARDLRAETENALALAKQNEAGADYNLLNNQVSNYLNKTFTALNSVYNALENSVTSSNFPASSLDAYKTTINTQISSINGAITAQQTTKHNLDSAALAYATNSASLNEALRQAEINLSEGRLAAANALASARLTADRQIATAKANMDNARESWSVADRQLVKLKSAARSEDLALADAQVRQAQANLELLQKQREDSRLKAPMAGQIVEVNYEVGEQFNSAQPVFVMLSENNYEIEVDVSETDIAKVKVNDPASVTFDALGEEYKFKGSVYDIEPSATVIQGVIYYKVKIALLAEENELANNGLFAQIKPEMTANVVIETDRRENALIIPSRAVVENNGRGRFVRVLDGEIVKEVDVTLGLNADDGLVEVLSGDLYPNQEVVTFIKENAR